MKFLIQKTISEIPSYDGGFYLIEALEYQKWYNNTPVDIRFHRGEVNPDFYNSWTEDLSEIIPIGTVEFVQNFYKDIHGITGMKPMNIPKEFMEPEGNKYIRRKIHIGGAEDVSIFHPESTIFIKSNTQVKGYTYLGRRDEIDLKELSVNKNEEFLFSEYIPITSEWRAFVFKGRIVDIRNYSGSFYIMPDTDKIQSMALYFEKKRNNSPPAYTIDVTLDDFENVYLLEFHDFYSCGHYGFNDYRIIPQMYSQWHHWFLRHNKNA